MATDPAASAGVPRFAAPRPTKRTCEDTPFVQVLPGSRSPCVKVRARYDFAVTVVARPARNGEPDQTELLRVADAVEAREPDWLLHRRAPGEPAGVERDHLRP